MSTLRQYQAEIAFRMRRGDNFAAVETQVIDPSALTQAQKAALWLYGWSFVDWRRQRREALAHLDLLARGEEAAELTNVYRLADVSAG